MQVKDLVCGMMLEQSEAVARSEYDGTTYYFCSDACKQAFDQDPERYIEKAVELPAQ
jgi:YHS domain-containing protein